MTWTAPPAEYATNLLTGTEREQLESWLDTHRQTLLWKCEGLTEQQLKTPASPPSTLTLLGLVRHLADCERWWFQKIAAGLDVPDLYGTDDDPDADLDAYAAADAAADLETFRQEVVAAREATAGLSLDHVVRSPRGNDMNLRWIYVHMIEEYARHNGHADFLREQLDGTTGDFPPHARD
ncbi:DinB family protein [Angustibacter sp. Root456]|uniref:DinB family protein n=1 Tax=Angustibacter sp. Root456 TaxID=1736539 RepID=UPI0006F2D7E3|nr:DinB family protein [Angustibacter sp. Root456]KQX70099.1 Mini-circle protein [Angustibacter sp. Root456]